MEMKLDWAFGGLYLNTLKLKAKNKDENKYFYCDWEIGQMDIFQPTW